ncbi:MAG: gamma-glutamyl-gamma-aminobutyrate hydrolase family protein [Phascolarctobacterium sp.]|nr:gamma-glutamyl-gamma-aminobutyrate hydrolase family protein [Phascolarctobacterium sp.]
MNSSVGYDVFEKVVEAAGGIPVLLKQVKNSVIKYDSNGQVVGEEIETSGALKQSFADKIKNKNYAETNVENVLDGIDGVFMIGGEDISSTLFKVPEKVANAGEKLDAARDISDYIIMAYCMDNDIPIISVCRGMQIMGIVAGSGYIQEIRDYYEANNSDYTNDIHRALLATNGERYVRHDVELVGRNSHMYEIVGADILKSVSSWHHQAVGSLDGTELVQTARTIYNGVEITEAIEHPGKKFCVGVQFHPENEVKLVLCDKQNTPADYDIALRFFKKLVECANF